jgi:uncharacterized damage-inducible protein DinB
VEFSLDLGKDVLRRTPAALQATLFGVSEEWSTADAGPGTWNAWQVVGHLTHIDECDWIDRAGVILEHGTDHPFEPVDREAGFARFEGMPLDDLLARFTAVRAANLETLDGLVQVQDLDRRGVHPTFGEVTLAQLLATWVVHDLNHLGQIVTTMAKRYAAAVGPWRALLPIIDLP